MLKHIILQIRSSNVSNFSELRNTELKSPFADFNFDEIMYAAANNDYWQNKKALWTIISRCM